MKHTPGPWTLGTTMRQTVNGIPRTISPVYAEGIAVAELPAYVHDELPMVEANAALIAAAPAMLAALHSIANNPDQTDIQGIALAAIRQATKGA